MDSVFHELEICFFYKKLASSLKDHPFYQKLFDSILEISTSVPLAKMLIFLSGSVGAGGISKRRPGFGSGSGAEDEQNRRTRCSF